MKTLNYFETIFMLLLLGSIFCLFGIQTAAIAADSTSNTEQSDVSLYKWGYWDKGVLPAAGPRFRTIPSVRNAKPNYRNLPPAPPAILPVSPVNPPAPPVISKPKIKLTGPRPGGKPSPSFIRRPGGST